MEIFLLYPLNLSADPHVNRSSFDHLRVEGCDAYASISRAGFASVNGMQKRPGRTSPNVVHLCACVFCKPRLLM